LTDEARSGTVETVAMDEDPETGAVACNLRVLRRRRGLSIERLAEASGVSRSAISDIERGRSIPTVNVVGRLSRALRVDFSTLVGELPRSAIVLRRGAVSERRRSLCPDARPSAAGFFEVRVPPHTRHEDGDTSVQSVLVAEGRLALEVGGDHFVLGPGDAIQLRAAAPCAYVNWSAEPALLYVVHTI
jgi:transcriptional regulator with XRE-family HTH domain